MQRENKEQHNKKHFMGFIYGRRIWIEAPSKEDAEVTLQLIMTPLRPYRNFWKRLKYLFTNN